ncbi:MAG: hypothetical protein AAFZ18_11025 [Myxococcota bacterium]
MLRPLLLLIFFFGVGALAFRWFRSAVAPRLRSGPRLLGESELRGLRQRAGKGTPLARALDLRAQIRDVLGARADGPRILAPVDVALGRIEEQGRLRMRIIEALNRAAKGSAPSVDEPVHAFEEREVMLGRLAEQSRNLEREQERTVVELSNLHLALLDISATQAVGGTSASLSEALSELEGQGETARRQKQAEAEVEKFLAAQKQAQ